MLKPDLEAAAILLDGDPAYRVLRRFRARDSYGTLVSEPHIGLYVDVEGTGLDATSESIIQFAGVQFEFDTAGNVGRALETYSALDDPGRPLSSEIVEVTGLTDERLHGQKIDDGRVAALLDGVELVIAHHAEYDRQMVERRFRGFEALPWACSQRDVEWKHFDCQYIGLEYLLMKACGEFFEPHDALDDCRVGLHILAAPRYEPKEGAPCCCAPDAQTAEDWCLAHGEPRSPFSFLLESVRQPTLRVWAWDSPYETKDALRLRRYRWDAERRCWRKDVKPAQLADETAWLLKNIYAGDVQSAKAAKMSKIAAKDRYSVRAS